MKDKLPAQVDSDGTLELPIVDFSPFVKEPIGTDGPSAAQRKVAEAIDEACRTHGFVCLRNTGIPREALKETFDASETFFSMSHDQKSRLKPLDPTTNTGYNGFGSEALNPRRGADLKEVFNIRNPFQENYTGFIGTSPEFQNVVGSFWKEITLLSNRFSQCCAIALGLETDYFEKTMTEMDLCTLRMLHYPPCPAIESDESDPASAIRVGEHTDFGAYTFLFVNNLHDESSHGLQVKSIEGGDLGCGSLVMRGDDMFTSGWKDVIFEPTVLESMAHDESCSLLVNTGALMARWTNDVWRATAHRVVVKPTSRDSHRYSIAVFFDPDKSTICSVDPKFVAEGEDAKYPPISSLDYLLMKLREVQGIKE